MHCLPLKSRLEHFYLMWMMLGVLNPLSIDDISFFVLLWAHSFHWSASTFKHIWSSWYALVNNLAHTKRTPTKSSKKKFQWGQHSSLFSLQVGLSWQGGKGKNVTKRVLQEHFGYIILVYQYKIMFEKCKNCLRGYFFRKTAHCHCPKPAQDQFSALSTGLIWLPNFSSKDFFQKRNASLDLFLTILRPFESTFRQF